MAHTLRWSGFPSHTQGVTFSTAPASWLCSSSSSGPVCGHGIRRDGLSGGADRERPAAARSLGPVARGCARDDVRVLLAELEPDG